MGSRITLVMLPCFSPARPPLSLAVLSGFLRRRGKSALIRDVNIDCFRQFDRSWWHGRRFSLWTDPGRFSRLLKRIGPWLEQEAAILASQPGWLGFSVFSTNVQVVEFVARRIKELVPGKRIVFGGPQARPYLDGRRFVQEGLCDFAVYSEGENALLDILDGNPEPSGSFFLRPAGIEKRPVRLVEPAELTAPDFHDFPLDRYIQAQTFPLMAGRGCLNHCSFCEERRLFPGYRRMTDQVLFESLDQIEASGGKRVIFSDSVLNPGAGAVLQLAERLATFLKGFAYEGNVQVQGLERSDIRALKKSGFRALTAGIESGSPRVLRLMRKSVSWGKAHTLCRMCCDEGIELKLNFIIGFPAEGWLDLLLTMVLIVTLAPFKPRIDPVAAPCAMLSGSAMAADPCRYGILQADTIRFTGARNDYRKRLLMMRLFNGFVLLLKRSGLIR
ncbi:MAG: radical SAM protein [Candidatus Wallbacteria bacterium]|nr:radical SAM protein [Candidatus Wallbacteria bacterium]